MTKNKTSTNKCKQSINKQSQNAFVKMLIDQGAEVKFTDSLVEGYTGPIITNDNEDNGSNNA
ncbi:hypothetical protein LGQ02_02830 [Bacillus shivajii]|uniref:hypothetical protein n=1 Tax=Bacillus shivajii TaxID=1983719 RepID=UPI001CFB5D27|nr:hypothetical protein [Bacillus shivajii]UCZ53739.1 hypothetical protein LGQ02_02830 [Bacillus shivajii]